MLYAALFTFLSFIQEEAPFKAKEDFEIKFDLAFKQRGHTADSKTVHFNETRAEQERRTSSTPLPYLKLIVKIIKVPSEEVKLKVIKDNKNNSILMKKTEPGMEFKIELGFTDDIKDKISGYKHEIQFFSSDKKVLSRILIEFDDEGNYFVNGEKRGKV